MPGQFSHTGLIKKFRNVCNACNAIDVMHCCSARRCSHAGSADFFGFLGGLKILAGGYGAVLVGVSMM